MILTSSGSQGLTCEDIVNIDAAHIWHPYGRFGSEHRPLVIREAQGVYLETSDHGRLIDGMSSWWAAIHGYGHPMLDDAAKKQLDAMSHVMFGGLTHEPAARLAQLLVELTPAGLDKVFFSDSGSVSVEVAIKMALQYWRSRGHSDKNRLLTWRSGYHGDTFMAMSVCDPEGGMHSFWTDVLTQQVFAPCPPVDYCVEYVHELEELLQEHSHELAALIVEPLVQGAGGMRFHHPDYLTDLRQLCDRYGVLLIFDEIATGFGRTGQMFAADHAGICPDIMCLGKALTGGYLSLAATVCTDHIATVISDISDRTPGIFMHGPTFMANPLACAVAGASIELLCSRPWREEVATIAQGLLQGLAPAAAVPGVRDVRVLGAIGVVQLDHPVNVPAAAKAALSVGVWLRPFRDLIYTMPAFIASPEEIAAICQAVVAAAEAT